MSDIQLYDEGTEFIATVKEDGVAADISQASVKRFIFQRKDKTTLVVNASFVTNGTDGKLHYFSSGSDFGVKGKTLFQVYLEMPSGKWHTSQVDFEVKENIVTT
jgi:hypothetical protein